MLNNAKLPGRISLWIQMGLYDCILISFCNWMGFIIPMLYFGKKLECKLKNNIYSLYFTIYFLTDNVQSQPTSLTYGSIYRNFTSSTWTHSEIRF